MNKLLNIWVRRIHRWLVLPFIMFLSIAIFSRGSNVADMAQRYQVIFMLLLALTGVYLFVLPYWAKWKHGRNKSTTSR